MNWLVVKYHPVISLSSFNGIPVNMGNSSKAERGFQKVYACNLLAMIQVHPLTGIVEWVRGGLNALCVCVCVCGNVKRTVFQL